MEGVAQCAHMAGGFSIPPTPTIQTQLTTSLPCDVSHTSLWKLCSHDLSSPWCPALLIALECTHSACTVLSTLTPLHTEAPFENGKRRKKKLLSGDVEASYIMQCLQYLQYKTIQYFTFYIQVTL